MSDLKTETMPAHLVCPDCKERVAADAVRAADLGRWGIFWDCPACEVGSLPPAWAAANEEGAR